MNRTLLRLLGAFLCIALVSSFLVTPAAAYPAEDRFVVELDETGAADVSITFAYDLDTDDERAAFESLRENTTAQAEYTERFENRMMAVADDVSAATEREQSVGSSNIELYRSEDVGVVVLSLEWTNLAAVDGDQLILTEPFASGLDPDRALTVIVPDGYDIASTTPEPSSDDGTSVTWDSGVSLDGFELVAEASSETERSETDDASPDADDTEDAVGFGIVTAVVALLSAAALVVRRQS